MALDPLLEAVVSNVFPVGVIAPCTWRYDCHANPVAGFDCTLFAGHASAVEFPALTLP